MNKCLCCNKPLSSTNDFENRFLWHQKCVKAFFGVNKLPEINMNEDDIKHFAIASINSGYTIPGVQKKLSLHLSKEANKTYRLTLIGYPCGYILKPQTSEYKNLPEAEFLAMTMAKATGIKTVPFGLLKNTNDFVYITKRIDRLDEKKLAMEDFCQLDLRQTSDKYKGSYERCAKIIKRYSVNAIADLTELFLRIVFSFLIGNSDLHLKNFSLIETAFLTNTFVLSNAYDILPVNTILPEDLDELALTLNGKNRHLKKNDFLQFALNIGLELNAAKKMIAHVVKLKPKYSEMIQEASLPIEFKTALGALIEERITRLS